MMILQRMLWAAFQKRTVLRAFPAATSNIRTVQHYCSGIKLKLLCWYKFNPDKQQGSTMIKRDVLHRSDIKTVYSSERQERMKVYFELTEQYNQCLQPCKLQPVQQQQECLSQCQKIYDQYVQRLEPRYAENKERLDMEVKGLPSFRTRARPDRQGWFYDLFGMGFQEFLGYDTTPKINTQERRI